MSYVIRLPGQLKQHLRALRKSHGWTQAQLGALIGVKQARVAEIEADPGAVSLNQLTTMLAALGATLHLHAAARATPSELRIDGPTTAHPKEPAKLPTRKTSGPSSPRGSQAIEAAPVRRKAPKAKSAAPRASLVIPPKKGTW